MIIFFEAAPIAYGYENDLADTGITRVIKQLLIKIDPLLECSDNRLLIFSKDNYWHNLLLRKFTAEHKLKNIEVLFEPYLREVTQFPDANYSMERLFDFRDKYMAVCPDIIDTIQKIISTHGSAIYHSNFDYIPDELRKINGLKFIHTLHDLFPLTHSALFDHDTSFHFTQKLSFIEEKDLVACVSNYTRTEVLRNLPYLKQRNVITIYNSGDYESSNVEKRNIATNYFLCVSTLEPRKNFPSIIKAYLLYLSTCIGSPRHLVIVGSLGWLPEEEKDKILKCFEHEYISYLGRVSDADLSNLLVHAEMFFSGSFCEGFGLGALEALMAGTPAITPVNTAQGEVNGKGGGVCLDNWNVDTISEMMHKSHEEEFTESLKVNAKLYSKEFSWDLAAREYLALYKKIGG
jgi:glycosyltransferase involved in cell wall biosynthesis